MYTAYLTETCVCDSARRGKSQEGRERLCLLLLGMSCWSWHRIAAAVAVTFQTAARRAVVTNAICLTCEYYQYCCLFHRCKNVVTFLMTFFLNFAFIKNLKVRQSSMQLFKIQLEALLKKQRSNNRPIFLSRLTQSYWAVHNSLPGEELQNYVSYLVIVLSC